MKRALGGIEEELAERLADFERQGKLLEAQRLEQRTQYDLEMMREVGFCAGIENYSPPPRRPRRRASRRTRCWTTSPTTSCSYRRVHVTVPQIHGQYDGDRSRKDDPGGVRLPPAFGRSTTGRCASTSSSERINQVRLRVRHARRLRDASTVEQVVEQIVRPTGLVDPEVVVKPTKGQIDDLIEEIRQRIARGERVLVTTLTKKMAEDLTEYLQEMGMRVRYLHSDIDTIRAHGDPAGPAPGRVRRAGRHQPAAGGPRPARGLAGRHPRRRQGGVPALRDVAHPDHRPGGPQRRRPGDHVRGHGDRLHAAGDRRDPPPPGDAAGLQPSTASTPQTIRKAVRDILGRSGPRQRRPRRRGATRQVETARDAVRSDLAELPQTS